ncbi:MAG: ECF-type sigma factor [Planctomycetota bacterium]
MSEANCEEVTKYLRDLGRGDDGAADQLVPLVYDELRRMAGNLFRGQRADHTLQPTGLVHEAYMRLVRGDAYTDRQHFFRVAAVAMRRLLMDYARDRRAEKRGGGQKRVVLDPQLAETLGGVELDLLALDEALTELARLNERQAKVVEMRFLAGLSAAETAEALGVTERTVFFDWRMARFWLEERLTG